MSAIHQSPYSGSWYPATASDLNMLLDSSFESSSVREPFIFPNPKGLIVPHAGPVYSGTVAAAAYRALIERQPKRILLLAFPHRGGLDGVAIPEISAIVTPLGTAKLDTGIESFPRVPESWVCDHSLEIQLPFLQRVAPNAEITPVYVGRMSLEERAAAADALAAVWQPGDVLVASSDFTHYGSSFGFTPFSPDDAAAGALRDLDFECIDAVETLDSGRFLEALKRTGATVCGVEPIALLLDVLRRLDPDVYPSVLDYQTSGERERDFRHSVSYAAIGFYARGSFELSAADGEVLLDSASETLRRFRETGNRGLYLAEGGSAALSGKRGVFVTLHHEGELVGCLGNRTGRRSLARDTAELTLSAATEDRRFRPAAQVTGPIDVEISVLTPFRRIWKAAECIVGKHGVYMELDGHVGLLLPQVAAERGWTAEEFLEALTRKSLLGPHALSDPRARIYVFETQRFSRARAA